MTRRCSVIKHMAHDRSGSPSIQAFILVFQAPGHSTMSTLEVSYRSEFLQDLKAYSGSWKACFILAYFFRATQGRQDDPNEESIDQGLQHPGTSRGAWTCRWWREGRGRKTRLLAHMMRSCISRTHEASAKKRWVVWCSWASCLEGVQGVCAAVWMGEERVVEAC